MPVPFVRLVCCCLALAVGPGLYAANRKPLTAIFSDVSPTYVRPALPDGSPKPIRYAFAEGEFQDSTLHDASIDGVPFLDVARMLATVLLEQRYVPGTKADEIEQMLLVNWGTTVPFDSGMGAANLQDMSTVLSGQKLAPFNAEGMSAPKMAYASNGLAALQSDKATVDLGAVDTYLVMQGVFDDMRWRADYENARMLGYLGELARYDLAGHLVGPMQTRRNDLLNEIEDPRYYVIVAAIDFQALRKNKERKILWITRFSMRAHGHRFDRDLVSMARIAAPYFGVASEGLVRTDREGRVEFGDLQVLTDAEVEAEQSETASAQ